MLGLASRWYCNSNIYSILNFQLKCFLFIRTADPRPLLAFLTTRVTHDYLNHWRSHENEYAAIIDLCWFAVVVITPPPYPCSLYCLRLYDCACTSFVVTSTYFCFSQSVGSFVMYIRVHLVSLPVETELLMQQARAFVLIPDPKVLALLYCARAIVACSGWRPRWRSFKHIKNSAWIVHDPTDVELAL